MDKTNRDQTAQAHAFIDQIMWAHRKSNILFSAFETGILEYLAEHKSTLIDISKKLNLSKKGVEKLLAVLLAFGIARKQKEFFTLSTAYKPLFTLNSNDNISGLMKHEIHLQKRWLRLSESIRSGKPIKKTEKLRKPEDTKRFIAAMSNIGRQSAPIVLEKIKFRGDENILDLAGGPGQYMRAFCEHYPNMKMTLMDLPDTIKFAKRNLAGHKAFERMSFINGDMFETDYGGQYDVIFISNVIHIFDESDLMIIFKKCYNSLNRGGRLLIKDFFLNENGTGPEFSTIFSLHMLLSTEGGGCYKTKEINMLFQQVGFKFGKKSEITENSWILEGIK